jgi:hypothetical protein
VEPWSGPATDYEQAQAALLAAGLTDGLPVIPPVAARVERMLAAARCDPLATVGVLPPSYVEVTWRDLAINAVMAGCTPPCLPIVGAAIAAMCAPEFNLLGIATTTGSACPLIIVNGPAALAAGMNSGANALGPGNPANATIGRAVSLVLRNVGGALPGEVDMATLGQPGKYSFCFAENEAASPWPPLHVERGFAPAQSVVTVVGVSGIGEIVDSVSREAADLAQTFAASMLSAGNAGSAGTLGGGEPVLVLPPEHVELFVRAGCDKLQVKQLIHERARLPFAWLSAPMRESLARHRAEANAAHGDAASAQLDAPDLRVAERAEDILIVVGGGVGRKAAFIPSWGGVTRAVSREIA